LRFLLDENVPRELARALSARGHDALELPPELRATADLDVLDAAVQGGRVLVTLDTDFGTLVFLRRRVPPPAVVLIRLRAAELVARLHAVAVALEQATISPRVFVVIDCHGFRVRPLV
jgi:predicted nuclease of predicted toxin-antitoxin system